MSTSNAPVERLVVVLAHAGPDPLRQALVALRYAVTAAALDMAVELHAVGPAVALLRRGACDSALLAQLRQAVELDVAIYACPVALAEQGLDAAVLVDEVAGVRGAASLLVAGMAEGARFMVF